METTIAPAGLDGSHLAKAILHRRQTSPRELMKAAVLAAPGTIELAEIPLPRPTEHQVRVRIEGCGVCGSNLPPWQGRPWFQYPFEPGAPGHEGWGIIDVVGDGVTRFAPGDRSRPSLAIHSPNMTSRSRTKWFDCRIH